MLEQLELSFIFPSHLQQMIGFLIEENENTVKEWIAAFALNAGVAVTFIQDSSSSRQLSGYRGALPWGIFRGAFCDAPRRYYVEFVVLTREYGIYLPRVHHHYINPTGENEDEKRQKSEGGTKSQLFQVLKIACAKWVMQWPLRWGYIPPWEWEETGKEVGEDRRRLLWSLQPSLLTGHCLCRLRVAHCFIPV